MQFVFPTANILQVKYEERCAIFHHEAEHFMQSATKWVTARMPQSSTRTRLSTVAVEADSCDRKMCGRLTNGGNADPWLAPIPVRCCAGMFMTRTRCRLYLIAGPLAKAQDLPLPRSVLRNTGTPIRGGLNYSSRRCSCSSLAQGMYNNASIATCCIFHLSLCLEV